MKNIKMIKILHFVCILGVIAIVCNSCITKKNQKIDLPEEISRVLTDSTNPDVLIVYKGRDSIVHIEFMDIDSNIRILLSNSILVKEFSFWMSKSLSIGKGYILSIYPTRDDYIRLYEKQKED